MRIYKGQSRLLSCDFQVVYLIKKWFHNNTIGGFHNSLNRNVIVLVYNKILIYGRNSVVL